MDELDEFARSWTNGPAAIAKGYQRIFERHPDRFLLGGISQNQLRLRPGHR
jgi:hypothetical protein